MRVIPVEVISNFLAFFFVAGGERDTPKPHRQRQSNFSTTYNNNVNGAIGPAP